MPRGATITGGRAVVDALVAARVDHAFMVPGESFMGVLDALYDEPRIRVVTTRHEGGAAFMAAAYSRLTGRPAVCMGTRMVGAGNMSIGIHTARQDSAPVIALCGQVTTDTRYREAFQEVDLAHVFAPVAKSTVEPPSAERLGELVYRAAREATSGRPGPVVVALREDLLAEDVRAHDYPPLTRPRPAPDPAAIARIAALLRRAERPLFLLGGGVIAAGATDACIRLAEATGIPVMTALRRPDAFPNDHPLYLGMTGGWAPPCVLERLQAADLIIAIGTRLNETATYEYRIPAPSTKLVHVDVAAESLGGHTHPEVTCVADARLFAEALLQAVEAEPIAAGTRAGWDERTRSERERWDRESTPARRGSARLGYIDQQAVTWHLRRVLPRDAVITTDAGNFGGWSHRYLRWTTPGTFLAPTNGAMGYGVPAAIAAKLAHPERTVVAFCGDGGMLMTGTELETAVRENTPIVTVVLDNQQYGTIRMEQERLHPRRPVATALGPVDFAAFARSLGAVGITLRNDDEIPTAFDEALRAGRPAVIHAPIDPQQLTVTNDVAATPVSTPAK
jgi:acetolactate synthase-1/2/3 large subunit